MAKQKKMAKKTAKKKIVKKQPVAPKKMDLSKMISPLGDRLIVQLEKAEKLTPGGLIIPDTADISGNARGVVVAVGRGQRNKFGKIKAMEVQVGDKILVDEHSGDQIEVLGQKVKIIREADVLGILD